MSRLSMKLLSMVFGLASVGEGASSQVLQDQLSAMLRGDKSGSMKEMQQALLSTKINPDVKGAMQKVITLINTDFTPTITDGHNAAQGAVKMSVEALQKATETAVSARDVADALDLDWTTALDTEADLKSTHEILVATREAAIQENNRLSSLEEEARPMKYTPPPNDNFTCDAFNKCTDAAAKRQENVNAWVASLKSQVDTHQLAYGVALKNFKDAEAAMNAATQAASTGKLNWEQQTSKREGIEEKRVIALCGLGSKIKQKCDAKVEYEGVVSKCKAAGNSLSHSDRSDEFHTMETTKCMLGDFINDVKITDVTLQVCENSVDFAATIGTLNFQEDTFSSLTSEAQFSCSSSSEMIFAGESYSTPTAADGSDDEFCLQVKA